MMAAATLQHLGITQITLDKTQIDLAISNLRALSVDEVGSSLWSKQGKVLEQFNIQAHKEAQEKAIEVVVKTLVTSDRMSLLVHNLLVFEVWKERVYPLLFKHLATEVDSVSAYMLLYHGAVLVDLLEICLFHEEACSSMAEEYLLELCDWCYRNLILLVNSPKRGVTEDLSLKDMVDVTPEEELANKSSEIDFATALSSLTILRYISDALDRLPLGVTSRIAEPNDTLMSLLAVMEEAPWQRRIKGGFKRYTEGRWRLVPAAERLRVSQPETQVWLLLHNMLVNPQCRAKCGLDQQSRREAVLSLRAKLNELLIDQLPFLKALQYVLDHLTLGCPDDRHIAQRSMLIIEQVCTVRKRLLARDDWEQVARRQRETVFANTGQHIDAERLQGLLHAFESALGDDVPEPPSEAVSIAEACKQPVKISTWRKIASGIYEPWSEFECKIDLGKPEEDVQLANGEDCILHGKRYRLKAFEDKVLPETGKIAVVHGSRSSDAILQIPTLAVRSGAAELAPAMWLTVGLLAAHGFALQLKLKKVAKPEVRDRTDGVWLVYYPVGGALTLLCD